MLRSTQFTFMIGLISTISCSPLNNEPDTLPSEDSSSYVQPTSVGIVLAQKRKLERVIETTGFLKSSGTPKGAIAYGEVVKSERLLVKEGDRAKIYVASKPNEEIPGHLIWISPSINPATKMIPVEIETLNHLDCSPGTVATIEIIVLGRQAVVIPNTAVVSKSGRKVVFTVSHGLAKWNDVVLGQPSKDNIEVVKGIKEGDSVISENASQLAHNSKVMLNQ